jgi:tRNA-specific 2-thiouridylase
VLFPLARLTKPEVRAIAERHHFVNARKKDSTGICFIGERNFKAFLHQYLPARPGDIVTEDGTRVGGHDGLMYYTKGQRRGLGIGGGHGGSDRWFVVRKDLARNELVVRCGEGEALQSFACLVSGLNWIPACPPLPRTLMVQTRYRQAEQPALVSAVPAGVRVEFLTPQRAVTEGQYAVFYENNRCLGGGVIDEVEG